MTTLIASNQHVHKQISSQETVMNIKMIFVNQIVEERTIKNPCGLVTGIATKVGRDGDADEVELGNIYG